MPGLPHNSAITAPQRRQHPPAPQDDPRLLGFQMSRPICHIFSLFANLQVFKLQSSRDVSLDIWFILFTEGNLFSFVTIPSSVRSSPKEELCNSYPIQRIVWSTFLGLVSHILPLPRIRLYFQKDLLNIWCARCQVEQNELSVLFGCFGSTRCF